MFLRVKQIEDASTTTSPIVTLITREYQLVVSVLPFLQEPDCSHELLIDVNCQQLQTSATQKRTLKITQTKNKKHQHKLYIAFACYYDGGIDTGNPTHESHETFKITKCINLKKLFNVIKKVLGVLGILYIVFLLCT